MSMCGFCAQRGIPACDRCLRPDTCTCDHPDHAARARVSTDDYQPDDPQENRERLPRTTDTIGGDTLLELLG